MLKSDTIELRLKTLHSKGVLPQSNIIIVGESMKEIEPFLVGHYKFITYMSNNSLPEFFKVQNVYLYDLNDLIVMGI